MPHLYLIAGPNGAGKTTASLTILPEVLDCREFVNADAIAAGLSPLNPDSVAVEAGRLMLQRIRVLLSQGVDFALETTLSTKSYAGLVRDAQVAGYDVVLLFFYLNSTALAKERVRNRVAQGGHSIPEAMIERRYERGLRNLIDLFLPLVNRWYFYETTGNCPVLLASSDRFETWLVSGKPTKNTLKRPLNAFEQKLTAGIQKAIDQMLDRARKPDEYLVIADERGQPKRVRARDLPERK